MTLINEIPLSELKAELVVYEISQCEYQNGYFLPPASMVPVKLTPSIRLRSIVLTIDLIGETVHEAYMRLSQIIAMLQQKAELFLPDEFWYTCVYEAASEPVEKAPWIWQVKIALSGYRHGRLESKTFTQTDSLFVHGTYKAPAIITIQEAENGTATVCGITVTDITSPVEINGFTKKVTKKGVNWFKHTDIVNFPLLNIGYNEIEIIGDATVEVSYYPIFL